MFTGPQMVTVFSQRALVRICRCGITHLIGV
jgi:hypothetical protein